MRTYLVVSGVIFGAVALAHILRLSLGWPVELAGWAVPLWFSWLGLLVAGALCVWGLRLAAKRTTP
jgi:hypothetical protein